MTPRLSSLACALVIAAASASAAAYEHGPLGGNEGEIDISAEFAGELGDLEPTERPTTWQPADIKIFSVGAGYTVGAVGPLTEFYVHVDGAFYIAGEEVIDDPEDDLPLGYQFFDEDKGGYVGASISANFVHEPRYSFGAFIRGTVPIDVELQKFSNVHLHYVSGGLTVGAYITDPTKLVRLAYTGRMFFGSGAFDGEFQHNAAVAVSNLFSLEFARWLLPWRVGLMFGPYFEGDLNDHVNRVYHDAYAQVTPDFVNGDKVQAMGFSIAVLPFIRITDHAALELGYVQQLIGYDAQSTQRFSAGVRVNF